MGIDARNTKDGGTCDRRWFSLRDLGLLAALPVAGCVAVAVPTPARDRLCAGLGQILPRFLLEHGEDAEVGATLEVRRRAVAARLSATLYFLRARLVRPEFRIRIEGTEHLDEALARGRGAVLWVADVVFANDVSKMALAEHGYLVSHLSRPEHGFSETRFGVRWLNPLRQSLELRYLRERIVYDRNDRNAAGATMRERLAGNGIVSILACAQEGRAFLEADFLGGRLRLAGGAPRLALSQECPLLPVFTRPDPKAPAFSVVIGAPLPVSGRDRQTAVAGAASAFLARLEPWVRRNPHLWRGWPSLRAASLAPRGAGACEMPTGGDATVAGPAE